MNQRILNKYFRDECSADELEQVLTWFQTAEGREFLTQDIETQARRFEDNRDGFLYPEIRSENIFSNIQLQKKPGARWWFQFPARIAVILLIASLGSVLLYWSNITRPEKSPQKTEVTYFTTANQQKVIELPDGSEVRLSEKSILTVPRTFQYNKRSVNLQGEAYFQITHDPEHPFVVHALQSVIQVLGTKFDVKTDSMANAVQVAVVEGKVALRQKDEKSEAGALLTKNHLGILHFADEQITIEKDQVANYLSWINNRLVFQGESLAKVSRQLERLYGVSIEFNQLQLKKLNLTADFQRTDFREVLATISKTLNIRFRLDKKHVIWMMGKPNS